MKVTRELGYPEERRAALLALPMLFFVWSCGTKPAESWSEVVVRLANAAAVACLVYLSLQCVRFVIREELERRDGE